MLRRWRAALSGGAVQPRPGASPAVMKEPDCFSIRSGGRDRQAPLRARPGARGARRAKRSHRHLCKDAKARFSFTEQHARTWPMPSASCTAAHGIRALAGRRFWPRAADGSHDLPLAPNLLKQDFWVCAPSKVRLADIACLPTGEGWLRLAAVLDLARRKAAGWSMRDRLRTARATTAPMTAGRRQRPALGLVCRSDRGSRHAAEAHRKLLA